MSAKAARESHRRIQVAKAPQGTLYRGSAIGGEIVYKAKQPRFDFSGEESIETGNFGTLNAYAAQAQPRLSGKGD